MDLSGKRVLITGANRGQGRVLVFAFVNAGVAEVLAGARNAEDIEQLKTDTQTASIAITPLKLDVTSDDNVGAAADSGFVDILVNNAGVAGYGDPLLMNFEDVVGEMNVNYLGALRMARALAPAMIERGEGMIVNIATAFAKVNLPLVGTYRASKAALLSLGQALRAYLGDKGVHVMTVMPTTIDTDMTRGADVPKMTSEFVAGETPRHIRDDYIDPPIGGEAAKVLDGMRSDAVALANTVSQIR